MEWIQGSNSQIPAEVGLHGNSSLKLLKKTIPVDRDVESATTNLVQSIRLIDTPDVGDTSLDVKRKNDILPFIGQYEEVNAVYILRKASEERPTILFRYPIDVQFKDFRSNLFCSFTLSRSTLFLVQEKNHAITLYHFDSEASIPKGSTKISWKQSWKEAARPINHIAQLLSHMIEPLRCKPAFSAEDDPVILSMWSSAVWVKHLVNFCRAVFQFSGEGSRCRKWKDFWRMLVNMQGAEAFRSKKFGVVAVGGLVDDWPVFRSMMCSGKTGLVRIFPSVIPKRNIGEFSTKDGDVPLLTAPDENSPHVKSKNDDIFGLDGLPLDILGRVLLYLPYEQVFQLKTISRSINILAKSGQFQGSPSRKKPTLTSCYFFIDGSLWKWAGYDASEKEWRLLPPLTFLPVQPDPDLFKEFLVCSSHGLVCINLSKTPDRERLIVFNPLSQVWKDLPPLNHRRNPVVMHMVVDPISMAYQVIVAGASSPAAESLSQITEVFHSATETWTRTGDVPGPHYALNEFQSGVYLNGKLFFIGFVEEAGKGIITYDVEAAQWSSTWKMPLNLPFSTILQLVESDGELYLFSERTTDVGHATYEHWIDRVEWNNCELVNVVKTKTSGGKSLEVYPEHVVVPYAEGQLCIMNAIAHTGVVYDVNRDTREPEFPLEAPVGNAFRGELGFFSLNPISFTVDPRFSSNLVNNV